MGIGAYGRQGLHNPLLVAGGDVDAVLQRRHEVVSRCAIARTRHLLQEAGAAEVNHADHRTHRLALRITNGGCHGKHRRAQRLAQHRLAHRGSSLLQRGNHVVALGHTTTQPIRTDGHIGNRNTVLAGDENPGIEHAL